jgi:hypothetical protein
MAYLPVFLSVTLVVQASKKEERDKGKHLLKRPGYQNSRGPPRLPLEAFDRSQDCTPMGCMTNLHFTPDYHKQFDLIATFVIDGSAMANLLRNALGR